MRLLRTVFLIFQQQVEAVGVAAVVKNGDAAPVLRLLKGFDQLADGGVGQCFHRA